MELIMTQVKINDPWLESIFKTEFNANEAEFLSKFKTLLTKERQREKHIISLLEKYKSADMSLGAISKKLNIDKEELFGLMKKYNVYLADDDYDLTQDEKTINKHLA